MHKLNMTESNDRTAAITNISNTTLVAYLKNHTLEEIEIYIANQYSVLAGMTPTAIDNYIDTNVVNLASAKNVLKVLAKDIAQAMAVLQITTKIATYTIKKGL